ncbi:MAG: S41 family peptidase [Bacteroidaceae bacterium]|nr:S41 family peptidase [Bacteroidaceae bacterium]
MKKILFFSLFLLGTLFVSAQEIIDVMQLRKLQQAHLMITNLYVDSVDTKKLTEDAIVGMLEKLDPHSQYSNPEETKKLNEPLEGNFEGIGVQFRILEDTLIVSRPTPKGPSEKVGVLAGDRIVGVNGEVIAGVKMPQDDIMKKLRGPKGTIARLKIVRTGVTDTLYFDVVRDKIPLNTVDAAYMIAPGVGYILLERFGSTSGAEVKAKIEELKDKGMKDLIFDLKMNGGGYLGAAAEVASEFLPHGSLVVYTDGRVMPSQKFKASSGGLFKEGRVIVLVDEYSASAAEIVSGALQDHDRALIVGRRTFGKGLVQRPIELEDGSMIRLTVSHYYTPSGRCIQKPYEKGKKDEYRDDIDQRYKHGELTCLDSIHLDSTKVYKTLVKGRTVYGGGGIMPDVFVPFDTAQYTDTYRKISRANLIVNESLRYTNEQRKKLAKSYPTFEDFYKQYSIPESLLNTILKKAAEKEIRPKDEEDKKATLDQLAFTLKALVAYDLWDRNEYLRIINERDDIVKRALQLLKENYEISAPSHTPSR